MTSKNLKKILLEEQDTFIIDSPYNPVEVTDTKKIRGARWDRERRVWTVPVVSANQVLRFAEKFGYWVDPAIADIDIPDHPVGEKRVVFEDGKFSLYFPYEQFQVSESRKITGARWDKKRLATRAPIESIEEVLAFAAQFDMPVENEEYIKELASDKAKEREELLELSTATNADININGLALPLYDFQKAGTQYAVTAKKCFIADEMGLGKTIQSLAAIEYLAEQGEPAYPALVVCPPNLIPNWEKEIKKALPHRAINKIVNRSGMPDTDKDFMIIGWSNIHTWQNQLKGFNSYIFDESHYAKNPKAQRAKAAMKMAKKGKNVYCLTGTPITNRPAEFAPQLDILGRLSQFGGLWPFYKRYAAAFVDKFGAWNITGASHLDELNLRLRSSCYIRRVKKEVLTELPDKRIERFVVEPASDKMAEYHEAEADIAEFVAQRAAEIAMELGESPYSAAVIARIKAESNEHLVRLSVLRRLAALAKLDSVYEFIDGYIEQGEKIVVAAHHRDVVDKIANKYGGLTIQGGMKTDDVEEAKHKFQTLSVEEAPVIVLSIQAAKTGHTLTAASNILLVELPWTPADFDQVVDRLHRIGQKESVLATSMLATGTIDEYMWDIIESKRLVVDAATEGTSGRRGGKTIGDLLVSFLPNAE